jgi:acetaldehyde dehydrogenase/alcohol dehydrogenase
MATDKAGGDENPNLKAEHVKMLDQVRAAQDVFATMSQEDADRIFTHVASVANKSRVPLAKMAAEETRMGVFEDKVLKNGLAW